MLHTLKTWFQKHLTTLATNLGVRPTENLVVTPPQAVEIILQEVDSRFGSAWNKNTTPSDTMATVQYRAGAKAYREQVMKVINVKGT